MSDIMATFQWWRQNHHTLQLYSHVCLSIWTSDACTIAM